MGAPFSVVEPDASGFAGLKERALVRIHDAGRTEIASGSLTVLVVDEDRDCRL